VSGRRLCQPSTTYLAKLGRGILASLGCPSPSSYLQAIGFTWGVRRPPCGGMMLLGKRQRDKEA
jgi:hypothetical protein